MQYEYTNEEGSFITALYKFTGVLVLIFSVVKFGKFLVRQRFYIELADVIHKIDYGNV